MSSTAAMLGLVPVPEPNAWIGELTGAYLIAGEYLGPCEAARGRAFDRDAWISALLALHPRDQYLYQLAALNHATNDLALLDEYQQRVLARMATDVAEVVRLALAGSIDGQPRRFLARQIVLLALRLVAGTCAGVLLVSRAARLGAQIPFGPFLYAGAYVAVVAQLGAAVR
jgi:hypothetical protein